MFALAALTASGCAGGEPTRPEPAVAGPPQPVTLTVRDLVGPGKPPLPGAEIVLDGVPHAAPEGRVTLALAPGSHVLAVRRTGFRGDLVALRVSAELWPRAQAVGEPTLAFELGPGESRVDLLLAPETLDVAYLRSLLDGGVTYRWMDRVDLHIDRTPTAWGFTLSDGQVAEIVEFARAALPEISGGTVTVGAVTTGTGLDWGDFLEGERPGAITIQVADFGASLVAPRAAAWTIYRKDSSHPGRIRSANVIVDAQRFRSLADFRPVLGHELGHALSLRHPLACRHWSRMDIELPSCDPPLTPDVPPGGFWPPADLTAGAILHAFRPGTSFARLPE